jgi:hypothetical protein
MLMHGDHARHSTSVFGNTRSPRDPSDSRTSSLHPYLVRYLIHFFDNDYLHTTLLDDFAKDFMARHRFFKPPPPKPLVSVDKGGSPEQFVELNDAFQHLIQTLCKGD